MDKVYFTADTHFGHSTLIGYDERPYKTSDEMDEFLIQNWNETVRKQDRVYHLGDFSWRGSAFTKEILKQLNGQIHLVKGNHDKLNKELLSMLEGQKIYLCHYALRTWVGKERGVWNLYGHSHGRLLPMEEGLATDVGVKSWNWKPVSFEELREFFKTRYLVYPS